MNKNTTIYILIAGIGIALGIGGNAVYSHYHNANEEPTDPGIAQIQAANDTPATPILQPTEVAVPQPVVEEAHVQTTDTFPATQFHYVSPATKNCVDQNGRGYNCGDIISKIPLLPKEAVATHWCENGVCMQKGDCSAIIGADPIFLNPEKYGVEDLSDYIDTNYRTHDDPTVCSVK